VNERVGVEALDRDGGGHRGVVVNAEKLRGREDEDGAEAFAAGLQAVAHRGVQAGGPGAGRRHEGVEAAFDASGEAVELGGEIHRVE